MSKSKKISISGAHISIHLHTHDIIKILGTDDLPETKKELEEARKKIRVFYGDNCNVDFTYIEQ